LSRTIAYSLLFVLLASVAVADKISAPPPLAKDNTVLQHYLDEMYINFHRLEVVISTPDAVRNGKKGDMLLYQNGGASYLAINTDSSTTWSGIPLQAL
jgi:hypothetical protein